VIAVEISEGMRAFDTLEREWEELLAEVGFAAVFSSPSWHRAWLDAYGDQAEVAVLTARENGRLLGVMPMTRMRTDVKGLYFRRVSPLAPGITDYQPSLVVQKEAGRVLPLMWDALRKHYGGGVYWWPNVPESDPALELIREYLRAQGMQWFEEEESSLRLTFGGRPLEEVEKAWTSSHRKDVRRQRKRMEEQVGALRIWQPETVAEAEPVLEEFFRVHDEKWLEQGFPGLFDDERKRKFFRAIVRRLLGKGLHFSTLRGANEDRDVSYHFGFFSGGWMQWYRPSYRHEYQVYSPSKLHIGMLMERGCEQGWAGFDFLLGQEDYKRQWADEAMVVKSIHAGSMGFSPAYYWFSEGRPLLKDRYAGKLILFRGKLRKWRESFESKKGT